MTSIILNIEKERAVLIELLENSYSSREKLFHLHEFFSLLIKSNEKQLIDSYIFEFVDKYFDFLSVYEPLFINPESSEKLIAQSYELLDYIDNHEKKEKYNEAIKNAKDKLETLKRYLSGEIDDNISSNFYFPLLEESYCKQDEHNFGLLESVSVQIKKGQSKNSFHIIPSERELENRIKSQIETSWALAISYVKKYNLKISQFHDVVVAFDKKYGFVHGNSFGISLTLTFIMELLNLYNAAINFNPIKGAAFTGGLENSGKTIPCGGEYTNRKTETIFYSGIHTFAVPNEDEPTANEKLKELNNIYNKRKLKIIGTENFDDIINRRDLVNIKKINPIIRVGKFALKHSVSIILIILLATVIMLSGLIDFDDNPYSLRHENSYLKVYNKNNKLIWSEKISHLGRWDLHDNTIIDKLAFTYDINNDGDREIILSNSCYTGTDSPFYPYDIVCLDKDKNIVWSYNFDQRVSTNNTTFCQKEYYFVFIGLLEKNLRTILYVIAKNVFFPTAVFGIDISTGKRATDIFWHSGQLLEGIIYIEETTAEEKILVGGVHNGYESASLILIDIDSLAGQAPAPEDYVFKNIPAARIEHFLLIPQTDFSKYLGCRNNFVLWRDMLYLLEEKLFKVPTSEGIDPVNRQDYSYYYFNTDFSINFIETNDHFQADRDKLVKEGKIAPPLTYTKEYLTLLKNNIKYWDGKKFISYKEKWGK